MTQSGDEQNLRMLNRLIRDQEKFIQEHLLKFVGKFSTAVRKEADTKFYAGLATILEHYLNIDLEVLQQLKKTEMK